MNGRLSIASVLDLETDTGTVTETVPVGWSL